MSEPLRICRVCGITAATEEELGLFKKDPGAKYGRSSICRSCDSSKKRKEYNNLDSYSKRLTIAARSIRKNGMDITEEEFLEYKDNASKCCICDKVLYSDTDKHLDHNHSTGKIRGVLCTNCNIALGHTQDNIAILRNMIKYLEQNSKEN